MRAGCTLHPPHQRADHQQDRRQRRASAQANCRSPIKVEELTRHVARQRQSPDDVRGLRLKEDEREARQSAARRQRNSDHARRVWSEHEIPLSVESAPSLSGHGQISRIRPARAPTRCRSTSGATAGRRGRERKHQGGPRPNWLPPAGRQLAAERLPGVPRRAVPVAVPQLAIREDREDLHLVRGPGRTAGAEASVPPRFSSCRPRWPSQKRCISERSSPTQKRSIRSRPQETAASPSRVFHRAHSAPRALD